MKGLLIKDLKLLKNQKAFLVLMAAICIGLMAEGKNLEFVFSYAAAMLSVTTVSTISYDDMDSGMGYLLTLPVSRKDYVREKYVMGILMVIAVFAALTAISRLLAFTGRSVDMDVVEFSVMLTGTMLVAIVFQSVMIPLQLKFGAEKSRLALLVIMAAIVAVLYGVAKLRKVLDVDISSFLDRLEMAEPWALIGGVAILALGLMGISYAVSLRVMKRRQF